MFFVILKIGCCAGSDVWALKHLSQGDTILL
jgi:hypothetical protein